MLNCEQISQTNLMFFLLFSTVAIIIFAYLCYSKLYAPRIENQRLIRQFTDKGWKVHVYSYATFGTSLYDFSEEAFEQYRDGMYYEKNKWSQFNVGIANVFSKPYIQIFQPKLIKQVFFLDKQKVMRKQGFFIDPLKILIGNGISYVHGDLWKQKRKIMGNFINFEFVNKKSPKVLEIVQHQFHKFIQRCQIEAENLKTKSAQGYLISIVENVPSRLTSELFFGGSKQNLGVSEVDGLETLEYFNQVLDQLVIISSQTLPMLFGSKFIQLGLRKKDRNLHIKINKMRSLLQNLFSARVAEIDQEAKVHQKQIAPRDLAEAFYLSLKNLDVQEKKKALVQTLVDEFCDMHIASTENVGFSALMLIYYISSNPEIKSRLLQDLCSQIGVLNSESVHKLKKVKYLQCCVLQTLRCYQMPPSMFPRELLTDIELGGVKLKKGSIVEVPFYQVHYKQNLYPNAKQFWPERWLNEKGEVIQPQICNYVTFGGGPRNCIGKQLTIAQLKIIASCFFLNFEAQFETLDLELYMSKHSAYGPQPIKMLLTQRQK